MRVVCSGLVCVCAGHDHDLSGLAFSAHVHSLPARLQGLLALTFGRGWAQGPHCANAVCVRVASTAVVRRSGRPTSPCSPVAAALGKCVGPACPVAAAAAPFLVHSVSSRPDWHWLWTCCCRQSSGLHAGPSAATEKLLPGPPQINMTVLLAVTVWDVGQLLLSCRGWSCPASASTHCVTQWRANLCTESLMRGDGLAKHWLGRPGWLLHHSKSGSPKPQAYTPTAS